MSKLSSLERMMLKNLIKSKIKASEININKLGSNSVHKFEGIEIQNQTLKNILDKISYL